MPPRTTVPCQLNNLCRCFFCMLSRVHGKNKLNWTDLHQVDPVTRRVIGRERQRHDSRSWLAAGLRTALQFSSVRLLWTRLYSTLSGVDRAVSLLPRLSFVSVECTQRCATVRCLIVYTGRTHGGKQKATVCQRRSVRLCVCRIFLTSVRLLKRMVQVNHPEKHRGL